MEATVRFKGWTPLPRAVVVGMERDNKVFILRFEGLPAYPGGTAYLHIDFGSAGADSIEIVDGLAEITRNITQHEGEKTAFVEIIANNDVVWHSDRMLIYVNPLPPVGEKIEQAYPTAFEQALAQTAADKAAAAKSAADAAAAAAWIVTEEAARQDAERERVAAETARENAEGTRAEHERLREDAENERVKAENAREAAEANREQAEAAREKEVADALSSVAGVENTVQANEQQRVLAERTRAAQEQARQSAEQSRVEAEQARAQAEQRRDTAETARADAESKRVQAEQGRVTAEQGRVEAEAQREETMAQHAEKIAKLEAEVAKKAEIDDTTVSNTEAWSSQHIVDMLCPPLKESGNPVVCYPVAGSKLGVTANWEPTQEGEGTPSPDNIRPIHGRTQVNVERCGENLLNISQLKPNGYNLAGSNALKPNTTYTFKPVSCGGINFAVFLADNIVPSQTTKQYSLTNYIEEGKSATFTTPSNTDSYSAMWLAGTKSGINQIYPNVQFMLVAGTTAPTTYSPYIGSTTILTLPNAVYGGKVGAEGDGKETWGYIESYAGEALPAEWICDRAVYADGATPPTGAQVAYKLATPVPFTATGGGTIKALSGTNTVLTDADAIAVKGRADPIRIIQQLQAASASATQALADVERAVTDI